jgi:hypothetical protein
MPRRRTTAIAVAAIAALATSAGSGIASAKPISSHGTGGGKMSAKTQTAAKRTGGLATAPVVSVGATVVYVTAFPTGGKGSGSEATCNLWTEHLQSLQVKVENAPSGTPTLYAQDDLESAKDDALDAGCAVID